MKVEHVIKPLNRKDHDFSFFRKVKCWSTRAFWIRLHGWSLRPSPFSWLSLKMDWQPPTPNPIFPSSLTRTSFFEFLRFAKIVFSQHGNFELGCVSKIWGGSLLECRISLLVWKVAVRNIEEKYQRVAGKRLGNKLDYGCQKQSLGISLSLKIMKTDAFRFVWSRNVKYSFWNVRFFDNRWKMDQQTPFIPKPNCPCSLTCAESMLSPILYGYPVGGPHGTTWILQAFYLVCLPWGHDY